MSSFRSVFRVLAVTALALAAASSARAQQVTRTWVSGAGDDAFPCSRAEPCKTFAGAVSKTARDGEISTLDPGGYGAVTITKSLTINGTGTLASILAAGTTAVTANGVTIDITDAADTRKAVRLVNIDINGASTGTHGIEVLAAAAVHVEDCRIDGFTANGIEMTAAGASLHVRGTTIRQVNTAIRMAGGSRASIDSCKLEDNRANGLEVSASGRATISNSSISHNGGDGLFTFRNGRINAAHNRIAHNRGAGVHARTLSGIRLTDNDIFDNRAGIRIELNAGVASDRSNRVGGNNTSQAPNNVLIRQ